MRLFAKVRKVKTIIEEMKSIETTLWNLVEEKSKAGIPIGITQMREMLKKELDDLRELGKNQEVNLLLTKSPFAKKLKE